MVLGICHSIQPVSFFDSPRERCEQPRWRGHLRRYQYRLFPGHAVAPNHKLHTIAISATDTDKDADTFTVTVSNITSSQNETPGEGCGQPSGKQGPDFAGVGNIAQGSDPDGTALTSVQLRAERCAQLGERVYDIEITCSETNVSGESNDTAHLTVIVPKSRSH